SSAGQDSDAPGADVPGGDGDQVASITPGSQHGTPSRAFTVKGYHASFSVLNLHGGSQPHTEKPEAPKLPLPRNVSPGQQGPTQNKVPTGTPPPLQVNVAGLQNSSCGCYPPDTSGAVGPNQFVQTVNEAIGIYDKTGNLLSSFTENQFFG